MKHEADLARQRLVEDLNRLEYRVEEIADWHTWFHRYPAAILGAAFGCAVVVGFALTPRRRVMARGLDRWSPGGRVANQ